jgi:predicted PurR-regulated permease PerM
MKVEIPKVEITEIRGSDSGFIFRVLFIVLIVALVAAAWTVAPVFIIAFGGIVVAAGLNNLAYPVARKLHVPHKVALGITIAAIAILAATFFSAFGAQAADRFSQLAARLPQAWITTRDWLSSFAGGRWVLTLVDSIPEGASNNFMTALPLAGGVVGWLANAAFILVLGIYFAADARSYIDGGLSLLPPSQRKRARAILHAAGEDLRKWLIAMALDMLFLMTITALGLWIIGEPFALPLGTLTGVAVFVPYIGPILSTIPGLLLALSESPELALRALAVYVIALQLEGNVTLPLLQRWTVHMPPVLSLLAIVGFGLLFGLWGVLLATPLAVVTLTIVRKAYVEDFLEGK